MSKNRLSSLCIAILLLLPLCLPKSAAAQSYNIPWSVLDGGGSQEATSTSYRMKDSIGQPVIGRSTSSSYIAEIGFLTRVCKVSEPLLTGDFNDDGKVWLEDFSIFAGAFGSTEDSPNWNPLCDLNGDGVVWLEDFSIFAGNFGKSISSPKLVAGTMARESDARLLLEILPEEVCSRGEFGLRARLEGMSDLDCYLLSLEYDEQSVQFLEARRPNDGIFGNRDRVLPPLVISSDGELIIVDAAENGNSVHGDIVLLELFFENWGDLSEEAFRLTEMMVLDQNRELYSINLSDISLLPEGFALLPSYPNPFNEAAAIRYNLPETSPVRLVIHNMLGQKVAVLVNKFQPAGRYRVIWDASGMASGIYMIRLEAGDFTSVRKAVLIR